MKQVRQTIFFGADDTVTDIGHQQSGDLKRGGFHSSTRRLEGGHSSNKDTTRTMTIELGVWRRVGREAVMLTAQHANNSAFCATLRLRACIARGSGLSLSRRVCASVYYGLLYR